MSAARAGGQGQRLRGGRGSLTPVVLLSLVALLGVAAVAIDGARLFVERRDAEGVAAAAAAAGVQEVDADAARYDASGTPGELDPVAARAAACDVLGAAGFSCGVTASVSVDAAGRRVSVVINGTLATTLASLLGWATIDYEASGTAVITADTAAGLAP